MAKDKKKRSQWYFFTEKFSTILTGTFPFVNSLQTHDKMKVNHARGEDNTQQTVFTICTNSSELRKEIFSVLLTPSVI